MSPLYSPSALSLPVTIMYLTSPSAATLSAVFVRYLPQIKRPRVSKLNKKHASRPTTWTHDAPFPFFPCGYGNIQPALGEGAVTSPLPGDVNHDVPFSRADDEVRHVSHGRTCGGTELVHPWESFRVHSERKAVQSLDNLNE